MSTSGALSVIASKLREDNKQLTARMRETHDVYEEPRDGANASSVEIWIDEAERSTLFLSRPLE